MRNVRFGTLFVVAAGLGLAACGSSEFEAKVKAWCEADGKSGRFNAATHDCACVASTIDSALGAEDKAIFLTARVDGTGSAGDVEKGVRATGVDSKTDRDGFRARLRAFLDAEKAAWDKAEASCKKG